jgi:anti-anti-sigma factor
MRGRQDYAAILVDSERIDASAGEEIVEELITDTLARGSRKVALDVSPVQSIDEYGLEHLLRAQDRCRAAGGELLLVAPREPLAELLEASQLYLYIDIYPSLEAAAEKRRRASSRHAGAIAPQQAWLPGCSISYPQIRVYRGQ